MEDKTNLIASSSSRSHSLSSSSLLLLPQSDSSAQLTTEPNNPTTTTNSSPSPTPPSTTTNSSPSPTPPSATLRLWRPAAQRNLRNQWSNLSSYRKKWASSSSSARSHATSLVNAYLSQRYMDSMELGVLSDMADIRKRASFKLFKQQELHREKLLSSYKDMVAVVTHMVNTSGSMRCFLKGASNSPLIQFSSYSQIENDTGDGGGIVIFTFWSISSFEKLAQELVQMFSFELTLKRLLVVELLTISCKQGPQINELHWLDELYPEEFHDLRICNLFSEEACQPVLPKLKGPRLQTNHQPDHDVLQVYLTSWLAEVNIDKHRVDDIFALVGEEMHVTLS